MGELTAAAGGVTIRDLWGLEKYIAEENEI